MNVWTVMRILRRIVLAIGLLGALIASAAGLWIGTHNGPPDYFGGRPPTSCMKETLMRDCGKLMCDTDVWNLKQLGVPYCESGTCRCYFVARLQ